MTTPSNNSQMHNDIMAAGSKDRPPMLAPGRYAKPKRTKDYEYHKEKMILCKQEERCVPLSAEQDEWLDDIGEESDKQELEAQYMYMEKIQEVLQAIDDKYWTWQQPITHEIIVLVKNLLIPLAAKAKLNANEFERALKEEMFDDLKNQTKVNSDSLIVQLNKKFVENADLKAQLQDKTNVNTEMRSLLNKMKGKSVDTKFRKPSVVRQPVAFRKSTCFVRYLQGNDLLIGIHESDLYTIALQESSSPTSICFMAKASPTQAWLWHRRLSHLNCDTINLLSKNDVVNGLPKLKFVKDQLCSSCEMGKVKRSSYKTKTIPSSKR
ncbi:retrovirus-related pol polyprotein from transposon TNT 1-94 [Tanacetum coccineum]